MIDTKIPALLIVLIASPLLSADAAPTREQIEFFETKVRPVLAGHCFKCHGESKHNAGLRLDSRATILAGGDSGPVVVPGSPDESLLVEAINYQGYEMPPDGKLSEPKIAALTAWVKMGAPRPGDNPASAVLAKKPGEITEEDRQWWAFQSITRPTAPVLQSHPQPANPIDAFVLAKLEAKHIEPNGPSSPRELVRRAFFDVIGLPPSPDEMNHWATRLTEAGESKSQSFSELIDNLLARPQYGERWGRHWLDVVRFAQTNGYERDGEKPFAWRYRDYVIKAFNDDKPYDRFILEQLAGDELPDASPESRIATGYYRLGVFDDEPDDPRQAEFDVLDDVMVTTGAAFLGLTLGCARCHDHKFDPIPHRDYYRMLSYFRNVRPYADPNYTAESATLLPISNVETLRSAIAARDTRIREAEVRLQSATDDGERKRLEEEKGNRRLEGVEWTLAVRENGREAPPTHILIRGNAGATGDEVQPGTLAVLGHAASHADGVAQTPQSDDELLATLFPTCGRRLQLARWIASPENPLTARVMANRVWHHHFGRGIVSTTGDFGKTGAPPTHPELLDWLAAELIQNGWSIKHLHRAIMLSDVWQRSSRLSTSSGTQRDGADIDPDNTLLWRQNLRRLEAEAIQDTILAVSGSLNLEPGGRGYFPKLAGKMLAGGSRPGAGWELSPTRQQQRRSVYTFVKRTMMSPMLEAFDYANNAQPMTERLTTTVSPQSLMLLNNDFLARQARALADRLMQKPGAERETWIRGAFELALQREPSEIELHTARDFINRQVAYFATLRSRMTFHPDVPVSLHSGYLNRLAPADFLIGPESSWLYGRGQWLGGYEGIMTVNLDRGPYALWDGALVRDGLIEGKLTIPGASELSSLIVRGRPVGDVFHGYEIAIEPRGRTVSLVRHAEEVAPITKSDVTLTPDKPIALRVEPSGPAIRVWVNSLKPVIDFSDPQGRPQPGRIGVRTWGAGVTIDDLIIESGGQRIDVARGVVDSTSILPDALDDEADSVFAKIGAAPDNSDRQALEAFCLLMLNLNELIYVD